MTTRLRKQSHHIPTRLLYDERPISIVSALSNVTVIFHLNLFLFYLYSLLSLFCQAIECDLITTANLSENVIIVQSTGNKYGNYISFGCKIGYNINNGSSLRVCGADGKWSGQFPQCSCKLISSPNRHKIIYHYLLSF